MSYPLYSSFSSLVSRSPSHDFTSGPLTNNGAKIAVAIDLAFEAVLMVGTTLAILGVLHLSAIGAVGLMAVAAELVAMDVAVLLVKQARSRQALIARVHQLGEEQIRDLNGGLEQESEIRRLQGEIQRLQPLEGRLSIDRPWEECLDLFGYTEGSQEFRQCLNSIKTDIKKFISATDAGYSKLYLEKTSVNVYQDLLSVINSLQLSQISERLREHTSLEHAKSKGGKADP